MKTASTRPQGLLALFATFLVVAGVVFVAILASHDSLDPNMGEPSPAMIAGLTEPTSTTRVLLVDADGTRLFAGGEWTTLSWPDDLKRLGKSLSQLEGIDATTGERVYLENGFVRATSSGVHSPDGRRALRPSPARSDQAGSVEIWTGNSHETIVLRAADGRGIRESMPIGWWDSETFAVAGRATSTRAIYAVSLSGTVSYVSALPDEAQAISMRDGNVWYVIAQPGEGLETPQAPPSELHRAARNGTDDVIAREDLQVIGPYAVRDLSSAYVTDDGSITLITNGKMAETPLGNGIPLVFLDETHLVVRRDNGLIIKDTVTGLEEALAALGEEGALVFPL